jgi:hypothetical protein
MARNRRPPQLGHGSVDDPDGTHIWEQLYDIKSQDSFRFIEPDIIMVRAPPSDQLLDVIMRGASVACQVSLREGFEVKVNADVLGIARLSVAEENRFRAFPVELFEKPADSPALLARHRSPKLFIKEYPWLRPVRAESRFRCAPM